MCVLYDMNNWHSEEPDLFTNVLLFISTVPAPQQASSSHHWPPTKTAFHSWSERFSAKLCPAWNPTPLLYPLTSTHSMPTSLEKERKFRAVFYWHDVCIYILVAIYLHISTQRPEYPLHTPFPVLMTSSEEQIFWERPRYPSKSYSTHTNTRHFTWWSRLTKIFKRALTHKKIVYKEFSLKNS